MLSHPTPRPPVNPWLLMPDVASRQDGVFTRAQARAGGFHDAEQRRLIRSGVWLRLAGAVYRPEGLEVGAWQRARTVSLLGRTASHATAAGFWGLCIEAPDDPLHGIRTHGRAVATLVDHRPDLRPGDRLQVAGLAVTSPLRTVTDVLCTWDEEPAIAMVTDALRRRLITPADLTASARSARFRTGVNRVRAIADSCSGEPWSMLEWRFHGAVRRLGPGWRFNVPIGTAEGETHIVDALHEPTGTVVELDGKRFHGDDRFQADRTRDQRLAAAGYQVVRVTWDDLNERCDLVMRHLALIVAVRARPRRIA